MTGVFRSVALLTVVALTLVGATGCGAGDAASGSSTDSELKVPLPSGINTLDATKANSGRLLAQIGLETLMNYAPDGSLKPWLAKSVSRESPTRYVYQLRRGVKFWNGNELTAVDVANALNYQRRPGSQVAYGFTSVKSVDTDGRYTVVVKLKRADPNWQYVAAQNPALIWEKKFQDENKDTFGQPGTLVMGTGPWKFDSLDPTTGAQLSANPDWWGGEVPFERIAVSFFSDENSMARAFAAGEIDVAGPGASGPGTSSPIQNPPAFKAVAREATLVQSQTCTIYFVTMNVNKAPWNDIHVRRAVAYALNPPDLVRANYGFGEPLSTILNNDMLGLIGSPTEVKDLVESLPKYPFSVAKAKAELAKSAYPEGFSATFDLPPFDNLPVVGQVVADQLKAIGLDINTRAVPGSKFLADIFGPPDERPSTVWDFGCVGPDPDALSLLVGSGNQKTGGLNFANYSKPEIDTLLNQAASVTDPAQRRSIYEKVLTIVGEDVPYAPFLNGAYVGAVSNRFSFEVNPYSYFNGTWALTVKPK